jgi:hypothetical protein
LESDTAKPIYLFAPARPHDIQGIFIRNTSKDANFEMTFASQARFNVRKNCAKL